MSTIIQLDDAPGLQARAGRRMQAAMTQLLFRHEFFSMPVYRMRIECDPTCDTMWTDGRTIGFNPTFVIQSRMDEVVCALAHEAGHIFGKHTLRRAGREEDAWNEACDAVNNGLLEDAGFRLPEGVVPSIRGRTPEDICDERTAQQRKQSDASQEPQAGAGPQQPPQAGGQTAGQKQKPQAGIPQQDSGQQPSQTDPQQKPQAGGQPPQAGQQQTGGQTPGPQKPQYRMLGEVRDMKATDGSPLSEAERGKAEAEVDVLTEQAARIAQKAGTLPAGVAEWVKRVTARIIPWQEVLVRFLDERSPHDYSWTRPNLRYLVATGFYMPSLGAPALGPIVIGFDTSGSMYSYRVVDQLVEEVRGLLALYSSYGAPPEVWCLWCDVKVIPQLLTDEEEPLKPVGHGGTSYAPVFEHVVNEGLQPRAIVYLTDGECTDFGADPGVPVLWLLAKPIHFNPPFGEVALIPPRLA